MITPDAGLHCIGWLPYGMDERALVQRAAEQGVDLVPVSNFSSEPLARQALIFGYSEHSPEQIRDGISWLAAAMNSV